MKAIKIIRARFLLLLCAFLPSCTGKAGRAEAEKLYITAVDAYVAEQYADGLEFARRALRLDKKFYQAEFLEGKLLFFSGKRAEAEKIFSKLISKYPAYTEARIWYIRCLILKGEYTAAKRLLDTELSFNQTDWRIFNLYSLLAWRTENYEERLSMNRRAETILNGSARVYIDSAITWHTLGLDDRAQNYLDKAKSITGANVSFQELENYLEQIFKE